MAQLRFFVKLFLPCLLAAAVGGEAGKPESKEWPKNIIVILAAGLPSDAVNRARMDLAKESSGNRPADIFQLPLEKMPIKGVIVQKKLKDNASGVDQETLKIMFSGHAENSSGNTSSARPSNLIYLAQQAGKATGLVTTMDVSSDIPATLFGTHFESSDPAVSNCSTADYNVLSMDVVIGQAPVSCQDDLFLEKRKMWKCLFNLTYNSNHLIVKNPKELNVLFNGSQEKIIGLLIQLDRKDFRDVALKALQFLGKNENGYFLVVSLKDKNPMATMKMLSQLLENLPLEETLLIVTSVEDIGTPCPPNKSKKANNIKPSSVLKIEESSHTKAYTSNHSTPANGLPPRDILENKHSTESLSHKASTLSIQKSATGQVVILPPEVVYGGNEKVSFATTESSTHTPELSTEKNVPLNKNLKITPSLINTESNSEIYDGVSLPLSSSSTVTILTAETIEADMEENTFSPEIRTNSIEYTTLPINEDKQTSEHSPHHNEMENSSGNSTAERRNREVTSESLHQGIPIYASGPGSSSFAGNLTPIEVWNIIRKYLSTDSTSAKQSEIKEHARKMNESSKIDLSAVVSTSDAALNWNKGNFLGLGIVLTYMIVILN